MDFIYLFRVLLKKKWIIIGSAIIAATIAYFLTQHESKKYRSSAQISTGFTTTDEQIHVGSDNSVPQVDAETKFNNVLVTFTQSSVVSLLSYNLILHDLTSPAPFHRMSDEVRKSPVYKQVNLDQAKQVFQSRLESMTPLTSYKPDEKKLLEFLGLYGYDYKNILKNLSIYRVARTDYIQIDYLSDNPELSAFVVNTIFQQFLRYYKNVRGIRSQESIDTLKSIMDKKKQDLDYKATLLRNRGITDIDPVTTSTYDLISQLQKDLSDERSNKTQKEYELKKIEQRISNLGGGTTTKTDQGNDDLVIAREAMNNAFKAWKSNPSDKSLESRYHQLQQDYNDKVVNSGNTTTVDEGPRESLHDLQNKRNDILLDIQASNTKIGGLQSKINNLQGDVNTIASESQSTESLKNEYTQANKDYQDAKNKYGEAIDLNGSALNNFRQVVYGQPAIEPEPSKRMVIVAMGGMAAMVTTMLIIILLTYLDSSIKTPAIFSRSVNLKLISMINFMDLRNKNLADIVANKDGSENVVDRNKFNAFRESIRKLRYEIESSRKKVFLFTSTKKGQGKTTLIQALAYSMSLSKKKILIIDTNFCNNDLTVQLQAEPVLEKIVPFKADASALLEQVRVVSKDVGVGTVYAIGSEGGDYTPSEILPRENLLQHLQSLTTEFDYIFLEGPPLNDFSDSKELAEYVEGVIAVFSAKQIIKQIDKQSISFFKELNGKFCGSILNMVDLENVNVA